MSELTIYKASAGSGKTFTLAVEYISSLICNPHTYRNILAVTFTNKATAEMKERIMSQLYGLSIGDEGSQQYLKDIQSRTKKSEKEIREASKEALTYILHDYNYFNVETIDSFFQAVMRNLARELNLSPNLNIELDLDVVLNDAVDKMFDELDSQSSEMKTIMDYIYDQISKNKNWTIKKSVKSFGKNLFNETVMSNEEGLNNLGDTDKQKNIKSNLKKLREEILTEGKQFYLRFQTALRENGIDLAAIKQGNWIESYFKYLNQGEFDKKAKFIDERITSIESWFKKGEKDGDLILAVDNYLRPLLGEAEQYRINHLEMLNSLELTLQHLNEIALLQAIKNKIKETNAEKNRFLLSETNNLLHHLIKQEDSSFIYEKIGTRITNIMIDEFQDTSRMQWDNFKMLLYEGLSQGNDSMLVGDVKQAIYRWRNGDWRILNNLKDQFGPFQIRNKPLTTNYRSETNIILFNNFLFEKAKDYLNEKYKSSLGQDCEELVRAYCDVAQQTSKKETRGYVKVSFWDTEENKGKDYKKEICIQIGEEIKSLIESGIQMDDIALLLRKKDDISLIADYLNAMEIPVVSDEAFRLDASPAIRMLVNALRVIADEKNKIALAELQNDYQHQICHGDTEIYSLLPEVAQLSFTDFYEKIEELKLLPLQELMYHLSDILKIKETKGQEAYFFQFFDMITEYLQNNTSDISSFLTYWDEKLYKSTIPNGKAKGIHMYTIHKSKGLQFHTVLVPFCDWSMETDRHDNLVWCVPDQHDETFGAIKLVPINYSNKMSQSVYSQDYLNERLQFWVDNLNLLYVAFTRAEKNLIIYGKKEKPSKNDDSATKVDTASTILLNCLSEKLDTNNSLEQGALLPSEKKEKEETPNKLLQEPSPCPVVIHSFTREFQFRQSNRSAAFIAGEDEESISKSMIEQGKLLHYLFSMIQSEEEIDTAIDKLIFEGVINEGEKSSIHDITHKAFSLPQVKDWYTPDWQVLNERSIIWEEHDQVVDRRPDRVMVRKGETVVVDFKFGKEEKSYNEQVKTYMNLLSKIGYPHVKGFLWYVNEDKIEEIPS